MAETILGALVYFVYVLTVALSPVLALATALLARRRSVPAALGTALGIVAAFVTLGATVALALVGWRAGLVLFLAGQGALAGLGLVPLVAGTEIVRRLTAVDREAALRVATAAWPLALATSFGVFIAPGGHARYNITFLSGPVAIVAWSVWIETILFGPGLLGAVGVGLLRRVR